MKKRRFRIFIDTNIFISKIISKNGVAGQVFDIIARDCTILICSESLAELSEKLSHVKFSRYITEKERSEFAFFIEKLAELVVVRTKVKASI